jgi:hypothetical protein
LSTSRAALARRAGHKRGGAVDRDGADGPQLFRQHESQQLPVVNQRENGHFVGFRVESLGQFVRDPLARLRVWRNLFLFDVSNQAIDLASQRLQHMASPRSPASFIIGAQERSVSGKLARMSRIGSIASSWSAYLALVSLFCLY